MNLPYLVEVKATIVRRTVAEDGEIVRDRADLPDVVSRLVGQMLPQIEPYATLTVTVHEVTARDARLLDVALRPADRIRRLVER